jgi:predicted SAM-dependent methyltransferase
MIVLNLGCGLNYVPGTVNTDRHALTADLQADALRLPLPGNSVDRIEAHQLVEHLGHAGTIYALGEWWRVLKDGATISIETPDRQAACRAAAEPGAPAPALHWVFGLPVIGNEHRTLFEQDELRGLVEREGFALVESTRAGMPRPCFRLTACKRTDPLTELRVRLRAGFVTAGIIDPLTAPPHLAHLETICDQVVAAAKDLARGGETSGLAAVLGATARYDPRTTQVAVLVLVDQGFVSPEPAEPYLALAQALIRESFPARLAAYLRQAPPHPGTQSGRLRWLQDQASLYLTSRLYPGEAALHLLRDEFESATAILTPSDEQITVLCAETLANLSHLETARGVRAFARHDYSIVRKHLEAALSYDADNPLPVWNLARLALLEAHRIKALEHYAALLEMLPEIHGILRSEIDAVTGRDPENLDRFLGPVTVEHVA